MLGSKHEDGTQTVTESSEPGPPHQPPKRRRKPWYAVADVLLRRLALAAFVLIALVAAIIAAVEGQR
jgi:hypothetical protein